MCHFHSSVEGAVTYTAMLFIPSHAPMDYYTKDYEKGLALYSSNVLIMEKCDDLLPDYYNFVRGVVASADVSLNISRETLQQNRQLKAIAKRVEKKITADKKAEEAVKEVKAEVKSAAEKTGAAVKETAKKAVKTAEKAVKTAAKATKAKKETVKKAVEAEIKDEVFVQFAGGEINVEAVVAAAKADYKAKGHRTPKTVSVYIKPEEGVAYYTVKGVGSEDYKVEL